MQTLIDPCRGVLRGVPPLNNPLTSVPLDCKDQVAEPSPCAPDLSSGFFFGGLNRVSPNGGEALQQFPLELIVKN